MTFIKKNIKSIILIILCSTCSFIYTYYTNSHFVKTKTISNVNYAEYNNYGDANYKCLENYTTYNNRLTTLENGYKSAIYPVGSIYMSVTDSTAASVAARFGGTWVAFAQGRALVGIGNNGTNNYTTITTGGAKTVTLAAANLPSHTHSYDKANANTDGTAITITQIPSHTHSFPGISRNDSVISGTFFSHQGDSNLVLYYNDPGSNNAVWASGSNYLSQVPGYYNARFGDTTANGVGYLTYTGSGTAHSHTIPTTSTTTGTTGSGSSFSVLNPYVTVYMWKRTA